MRPTFAFFLAAGFAFASQAMALDVPGPLVSTEWLSKNQNDVRILDVRNDPTSFKEGGHIIGAVPVDFKKLRETAMEDGQSVADMSVGGDAFQAVMREAGVSADQPVVLTHRSRGADDVGYAAYLYWQLKRHGHDNVAILDGGTSKWIAESREVWGEDETVEPGNFVSGAAHADILTDTSAVKSMQQSKSGNLLDARLFEYYIGLDKRPAVPKEGHIPGALSFPFNANIQPDGTFRSADKLGAAVGAVGLKPDKPAVTYCNTGHVAAIAWFVLHELLRYPDVKLYDGSMLAWTLHGNAAETSVPR